MGLTGVDGVFRSCCKRTMQVLRENKDIIITLLEVLLYDPLDTWVINTTPATPPSQRPGISPFIDLFLQILISLG